jgi:dUTP pyrophosphatase
MTEVLVSKVHADAQMPKKATVGSACFDLYAVIDNEKKKMLLAPKYVFKVRTGLKMSIPEGYALEIRPRSGVASESVIVINSPGTIDSDYRGEILIPLYNMGLIPYPISTGDRIAQCKLVEVIPTTFSHSAIPMADKTERGEGGFGSTGK